MPRYELGELDPDELGVVRTAMRRYRKDTVKQIGELKVKFGDYADTIGQEGRLTILERLEARLYLEK